MQTDIRGPIWFWFYRFLVLFPLVIGAIFPAPGAGRGFLLNFAVACGYVGLSIVALEFSLVARLRHVAGAFGQDALEQFHRQMAYVAILFLLAHPILLMVCGYPLGLLNPFSSGSIWAWRWGAIALFGLVVLMALSMGYKLFRMSYAWWHVTHRLLAPAVLIAALLHIFMVNGFTGRLPMRFLWVIYLAGFLGITIYHRVYTPIRMWRRPWVVVRNSPELGSARTLVLEPVGHAGLSYEPGQFAWLNLGKTPFCGEEHPISFSTSAENPAKGAIAFTIKALGDWSSTVVPKVQPGTRVWVDGPYGVFSPDREQGPGYVLLGGGIGITPLYSMCLTMADRGDARPFFLFYGGRSLDDLTFHDEIDQLTKRMNLKCIYVLERASADWRGETGFIDANLLQRYLPQQYKRYQYFICGPLAMMDAMERVLPAMGIARENIHTERFGEV